MLMLLEYREKLISIYRSFENYIRPAFRFIALLLVMIELNASTGYSDTLSGMLPTLIIALLGALIPVNYTAAILLIVTTLQLYSLSLETGIIMAGLMLLIFLAYLRFSPKDTWLLILMPLFAKLGIPYLLAIAGGLLYTPFSAVSCGLGLLVAGYIGYAADNSQSFKDAASSELVERFRFALDGVADDKKIILMIISLAGIVVVVWVIRRLQIKMAWTIAIGAGAVAGLLILLIGDMRMNTGISIGGAFLGMLVSVILALAIQFMMFNLDYSGIENVQFEDDSYYYYVRAVPKVSVAAPARTVKKISPSRGMRDEAEQAAGNRPRKKKNRKQPGPAPVYDDTQSLYMQDDGDYDFDQNYDDGGYYPEDGYYADDDAGGGNWS
ncbi:MAG: hypothetical protein IJ930_07500 [Lachnospiraceae bacterium]|nr:hypothetical protein [Lachnospiraceae bacterium]